MMSRYLCQQKRTTLEEELGKWTPEQVVSAVPVLTIQTAVITEPVITFTGAGEPEGNLFRQSHTEQAAR